MSGGMACQGRHWQPFPGGPRFPVGIPLPKASGTLARRRSLTLDGPAERGKEAAGIRAAEAIRPGMVLGLGTGSTVAYFLVALGRRFARGEFGDLLGWMRQKISGAIAI